jgi:hypothetical protein
MIPAQGTVMLSFTDREIELLMVGYAVVVVAATGDEYARVTAIEPVEVTLSTTWPHTGESLTPLLVLHPARPAVI